MRPRVTRPERGAAMWTVGDVSLRLEGEAGARELVVRGSADARSEASRAFDHPRARADGPSLRMPADAHAAAALRRLVPSLAPAPLGLRTSVGFGDRLGSATPGHARALHASGADIAPIFAQQSIREMTRTGRQPGEVLDDATWGAFFAGVTTQVGADADHLKDREDVDRCAAAGYSFFTVDPGAHVDARAGDYDEKALRDAVGRLPWERLASSWDDTRSRLASAEFDAEGRRLAFDEEALARAAAKYGGAVAHTAVMYRHLEDTGAPFELEVSVDETQTPTSHLEHAYIAVELARLGVRWVSLAPRFVGRFEKGVDYIGDVPALREDVEVHAALARTLGPYKLSLHSGSDKFSAYPLVAEATRGLVHLKTAGTSYLEALRVVGEAQPDLFRSILALSRDRFEHDRVSYHIHADLAQVPDPDAPSDAQLPGLLDQDHTRQLLHVTYGSVLDRYRTEIERTLQLHEDAHVDALAAHFGRHLAPFAAWAR